MVSVSDTVRSGSRTGILLMCMGVVVVFETARAGEASIRFRSNWWRKVPSVFKLYLHI
jgi:hypothetical protein